MHCKTLVLPKERERGKTTLLRAGSELLGRSLQTLGHHLAGSPAGTELRAIIFQSLANETTELPASKQEKKCAFQKPWNAEKGSTFLQKEG